MPEALKRAREDADGEEPQVGNHSSSSTPSIHSAVEQIATFPSQSVQPPPPSDSAHVNVAPEENKKIVPQGTPFAPPPGAGTVQFAELWYFIDDGGAEQGPHSAASMRAWFEAGYFPLTCRVAASYYGEVPETYWPISDLWEHPAAEAFVLLLSTADEALPEVRDEFFPSNSFVGAKEGYCFKADVFGVGYYLDQPPEIHPKCTWQELEKVGLSSLVSVPDGLVGAISH